MAPAEPIIFEDLDESELSAENGEVYVFGWLASTEKAIHGSSSEHFKSKQSDVEKALVKIVLAPEPYPLPGRALRNMVARNLIALYTRGETRTLFDTLQAFMKVVGEFKLVLKDSIRIAAFSCIGDLMGVFGSQVMSFMMELGTVSLKTIKSYSSTLLRYHALIALKKALTTAKRAVTDQLNRDITKQMRNALTDKALPVQRAAAEVLVAMYTGPDANVPTLNEVDQVLTLCVRSLENADQVTRRALSQLICHLLASTQIERAVPVQSPPPKQTKNEQDQAEPGLGSPTLAATEITKPMLTPTEMLMYLSTQFHKNTSRKVRIGIFDFYAALLIRLGPSFAEANFALIINHLLTEIVSSPRTGTSRYETLLIRTLVGTLLRDLIGVRMLTEQGQISAIQELATSYLKRWPAMMPGQVAPNSKALVIVLREVAGLLQQLGNAPPPVQDALSDPLITLLAHTSHSVRVTAAYALRSFCYSTPLRLPKAILKVTDMLQRDINNLPSPTAPADITSRSLGHAYGLAALVSIIPERPLYVSYDISAKVLDVATQLLKRAGEHDIKIAAAEVEVAWTLIAALMSLGPNFVRPHLPQLLVLWRNALPKPTSKDSTTSAGRSAAEWGFLLHVRDCALGAILCFLRHNLSTLVTLDVARRIASVLSNALTFANNFISLQVEDPAESQLAVSGAVPVVHKGLTLKEREALLRRRVYQCFTALGFSSITEQTQSTLLQSVVSLFASPDGYIGSSMQAAIASSSGTFTSVWSTTDGYAYGVTSHEVVDLGGVGIEGDPTQSAGDHLHRDSIEARIDELLRSPILGGCEHDPLFLCQSQRPNVEHQADEPPPPATYVVDSAIDLFAQLLPLQDLTSTSKIITQLLESVKSPKLEKNTGRRAAVQINAVIAIVLALRQAASNPRQSRDTFGSSQITNLLSPFLKDTLVDGDITLRTASSESIGRLASFSDTNFLTSQIKHLVDQVVNNRDPNGRAGCALAFGAVYTHVGGLAAGPLLKTTVNVLMSLANDPHPIVYFWALNALARVINAASLAYAPFVPGTLGMLLKIYVMDTHEREGGTLANANLSGDFPAYPLVCRVVDAVTNVLGPDMQESARTRTLILNLIQEFLTEDDEAIVVEAITCIQHFLMYAPEHVDIPKLVQQFRGYLSSPCRPLKLASINALYQLVQRDALAMSKLGGDQLVEDLFGMLDDDSSVEGVRNVISSWLQQTVVHNPSAWIDLCQRIMARTTASQQVVDAASRQQIRDDEGESLNIGMSSQDAKSSGRGHQTSRWRTQLFALKCLHQICTIVAESGRKEHLDIIYARKRGIATNGLLFTRVPDLIKMAFTASTAYVTEIRLEGLVVLQDVIQIFALAPDPAYDDALLLEQHQAPITAALTPAFSADSTPEILASAVHACAVFVGCGVVKDISRMGRILKLLTTALEQSKDAGMVSLGETGELSPNASAMLRISTLSAWGQLEVASARQSYLVDVLKPHRPTLASLWVASLRDYASIRTDSEFLHDTSSAALDSSYSSLGKEVLLPYYADAWSIILQAVATAMTNNDGYISAAVDGHEMTSNTLPMNSGPRTEPAAFFYIIFGIVYEALSTSSADSTAPASTRLPIVVAALQTLKSIVKPEYAGNALSDPTIFDEFVSLCYRIAMTEPAVVQVHLIQMLVALAASQELRTTTNGDPLSLTTPRAHCLRICAYILRHTTSSSKGPIIQGTTAERITMISGAFSAFITLASSHKTTQREDVRGVAILLYSDMLKDESSEIDLVGSTLPSLKSLLDMPLVAGPEASDRYERLIHGLLSSCLLNIDQMSGRQGLISAKKVKNNLLAAVLILTVIPPTTKVGLPVIEHCCVLISQKLLESDEISITAVHCAKTLVVASTSGNSLLRQCAKLLFPGLIEYIAKMAPHVHDNSLSETQATGVNEVWKAFSSFFAAVPEDHRARFLGVLLPTISLLLTTQTSPIATQTVAQVLSYATSAPAAFKEAAGKLEPATKELLEQAIRKAVGNATPAAAPVAAKPQISLRSF